MSGESVYDPQIGGHNLPSTWYTLDDGNVYLLKNLLDEVAVLIDDGAVKWSNERGNSDKSRITILTILLPHHALSLLCFHHTIGTLPLEILSTGQSLDITTK